MLFLSPINFCLKLLCMKGHTKVCQHVCAASTLHTLVMLRHGQSSWEDKFCGWYNAELTEKGIKQAHTAAKTLKENDFTFDVVFTSALNRTKVTASIILKELEIDVPVKSTWRLNERHYGALTGLDKVETAEKYGEEKVQKWRRGYDSPPPPIEKDHPYYKKIVSDPVFKDGPFGDEFPRVESLKHTIERVIPYWNNCIVPEISEGKNILIVGHGTSLRGIVKYLDNISNDDIRELNLPTGTPFVYTLGDDMFPVEGGSLKFLGNQDEVKKAMEDVKNQIKKKR